MDRISSLLAGDRRAAARLITLMEDGGREKEEILQALYPAAGKAFILGITGSPGAGKSSLVDHLVKKWRQQEVKVGVIAVDPTSPYSGGALLGDRIRLQNHANDRGVFIRSMGTRGNLGGLAQATQEAALVLDAFGCEVIILETVGVGQGELDIMTVADTTVVVLTPGAGDGIQVIKAGIMEIADIFAVNKADMDGAQRVKLEVEAMLALGPAKPWTPPVVTTSTVRDEGIDDLMGAIETHRRYLESSGEGQRRRRERRRSQTLDLVEAGIKAWLQAKVHNSAEWKGLLEAVESGERDPYSTARELLDRIIKPL